MRELVTWGAFLDEVEPRTPAEVRVEVNNARLMALVANCAGGKPGKKAYTLQDFLPPDLQTKVKPETRQQVAERIKAAMAGRAKRGKRPTNA